MLFFNRCSSKLLRSSAHDMSVAWDIFCLNPAGIGDRKVAKLVLAFNQFCYPLKSERCHAPRLVWHKFLIGLEYKPTMRDSRHGYFSLSESRNCLLVYPLTTFCGFTS